MQRGARMNKIILLGVLLVVGCSSPVRRFRAISNGYHSRSMYGEAITVLQQAENSAYNGAYCDTAYYSYPVDSVYPIAAELKKIDKRLNITVQPLGLHKAVLIVGW